MHYQLIFVYFSNLLYVILLEKDRKSRGAAIELKLSDMAYARALQLQCSSKISVDFQRATYPFIPGDSILQNDRCEDLRSCILSRTGGFA
jgi:hypothetical protein